MASSSPVQGMSNAQITPTTIASSAVHRDEEKIRLKTEQTTRYYLTWRKHESESLGAYLCRLGSRGYVHRDPGQKQAKVDTAMKTIALPLGMMADQMHHKASALKSRSFNKGHRSCCCTDVTRLTKSVLADTGAKLTLAELQQSAQAKKGCIRCWLLKECIMQFADRWGTVPASEVILSKGTGTKLGSGPVALFTIFWADLAVQRVPAQSPRWSKLTLEVYSHEGGHMLYPTMRPRERFLVDTHPHKWAKVILRWIEECTVKHHLCSSAPSNPYLPTRLVDVGSTSSAQTVRLVCNTSISDHSVKYAALSHSWGLRGDRVNPIPKTKKATLKDRLDKIPWDELTPVFKDSILLSRCLGLRYIWIDSLCIVQDDEQDFAVEASQMASIYGEAYIVIANTRARTGDMGLFHNRPEPTTISHVDRKGKASSVLVREKLEHDDFQTAEPRHFTTTPLFSRAWCFQERLLARRVVHFAEHELVFECKEGLECECGLLFSQDGLYHSFKGICAYGLVKLSPQSRYRTWYSVVRPYTARTLTFENDRLPALSGFARLVAMPEMGAYYAGLWENELPQGLLWRVVRALPENNGVIERPRPYRAPTWCWAGIQAVIEGHIQFLDGIDTVAKVQKAECTLSGPDPFGEVSSGYLILEAPAVQTVIRETANSAAANGRDYLISRAAEADNTIPFASDLHVAPSSTICVAIEHDLKGSRQGRWSCLVLQKDELEDHYYRIGTVECPHHWFTGAATQVITIL